LAFGADNGGRRCSDVRVDVLKREIAMKKLRTEKLRARDHIKQLRCNIKTMQTGRLNDMQSVFDAFEIKFFDKGEGCRIERKKGFLKSFF
jgi:hypothetical protein